MKYQHLLTFYLCKDYILAIAYCLYLYYHRHRKLLKPFKFHIYSLCLKSKFLCRPQNIGFIHAVISNGKDMLNLRGVRCDSVKLRNHHKTGQAGVELRLVIILGFWFYIFFYSIVHAYSDLPIHLLSITYSLSVIILRPLYSFSLSISLSPVTIISASPLKAHSRMRLSGASLRTFIFSAG